MLEDDHAQVNERAVARYGLGDVELANSSHDNLWHERAAGTHRADLIHAKRAVRL